jgi:acyl transferase domain-containing protein
MAQIPTHGVPLISPDHQGARRISVSGFGYGGTNAHVILEAPFPFPRATTTQDATGLTKLLTKPSTNGTAVNGTTSHNNTNGKTAIIISNGHGELSNGSLNGNVTNGISQAADYDGHRLYVLSAASEASLLGAATNLAKWLSSRESGASDLSDLSYTLATRRSLHAWRSVIVSPNTTDLIEQLSRIVPVKARLASRPQIAFIFTGQGAQWHAMGRETIASSQVFRDSITKSSILLKDWGNEWSLEEELLRDEDSSRLGESQLAQPATTAIQIALVDLFASFGIAPQRVCGHSSGEIGAAYAAGCLSHEAALKV